MAARAVTVTTSATRLDSTSDRHLESALVIYNNSAVVVYVGSSANLTTSTGLPVAANSYGPSYSGLAHDEAVYGIVAAGTADVRVDEIGI